jgi:hypothetical protein
MDKATKRTLRRAKRAAGLKLTGDLAIPKRQRKQPKNQWRGRCYEAAYKCMNELHSEGIRGAVLVQGLVTGQGPIEGRIIGHAWVELGSLVFDWTVSTGIILRQEYYRIGKIKPEDCNRYTLEECFRAAVTEKHYGPWGLGLKPASEEEAA